MKLKPVRPRNWSRIRPRLWDRIWVSVWAALKGGLG